MEKAEKVKENVENIIKVRKNMLKVEKERQKLRKCQFYQPSTNRKISFKCYALVKSINQFINSLE